MRWAVTALLGVAMTACSSIQPVAVRAGDVCFRCRRTIEQTKIAAEIIGQSGQAFTFRTPLCLAKYLQEHPDAVRAVFVTDHRTGKMIPAAGATFVRVTIDDRTGERDYRAFRAVKDAVAAAKAEKSAAIDWPTLTTLAANESGAN